MSVVHAVVCTEVVAVVGHAHAGTYAATDTYRPVEVFTPVGIVAAADIAYSTGILGLAEQGLAEAHALAVHVGLAAVAYHQAKLMVVAHGADMGVAEVGVAPAVGAAMGGIVYQACPHVVEAAHGGRIA